MLFRNIIFDDYSKLFNLQNVGELSSTLLAEPFVRLLDFGVLENDSAWILSKLFIEHALHLARIQFRNPGLIGVHLPLLICREFYLFARCNMSSAGCSTPELKSVREATQTLGSPQTQVNLGIRKGRKDEKDFCRLCSVKNLYGAGSTYNLINESWKPCHEK